MIAMPGVLEVYNASVTEEQTLSHGSVCAAKKLIEDMIVALIPVKLDNSALLKQIPVNVCSSDLAGSGKLDTDKLAKTRRVVVANGLGVSESLEYRVCAEDLLREIGSIVSAGAGSVESRYCGEVLDDLLCVFRLSSTRLSRDKNALIRPLVNKVSERLICHGEDVWLRVFACAPLVHVDIVSSVDWQGAVGVDCDKEETRVSVDEIGLIPSSKIVDNGGFIEMCELGHVIGLVKFSWVDLVDAVLLNIAELAALAHMVQHQVEETYTAVVALYL